MALCCEIDDCTRLVLGQQALHEAPIADVAVYELMVRVRTQRRERVQVACVGERIEIDHTGTAGHRAKYEITTDVSGSARHQQDSGCFA